MRRAREGFALLAVLWVLVIAASVGMLLMRSARDAMGAARNRVSLARATWAAEGCAERARAMIDVALRDERVAIAWRALDATVRGALPPECDITLVPDGIRLDVNTVADETLRHLAREAGMSAAMADSLVDARADWCDADDQARTLGAERVWYRDAHRAEPRNGALASIEELMLVRGFAGTPQLDSLLTVESSRVWLERAPAAVLATLPGFTPEAVAALMALRVRPNVAPADIAAVTAQVSPAAQRALLAHYQELASLVTTEPEAWTLTSRAVSGAPGIESSYELRLVRSGTRAAIVRRRQWP